MSKRSQPGLDDRHRDVNGQIDRKHGNTLVGTLRQTYGDDFAADRHSDTKLIPTVGTADSCRSGHSLDKAWFCRQPKSRPQRGLV